MPAKQLDINRQEWPPHSHAAAWECGNVKKNKRRLIKAALRNLARDRGYFYSYNKFFGVIAKLMVQ